MDLTRVMNIIAMMPVKHQRAIMSLAKFDGRKPSDVWMEIINAAIACCKNAAQREILQVYKSVPVDDHIIEDTFGGLAQAVAPISFTDEQIEWIKDNVYRNREGRFRIIPGTSNCTVDSMPLDGLEADEDVIEAKLSVVRKLENGVVETFDGLRQLKKQHYEPPYDGVYKVLGANLQRINIISSFEQADPTGFFKRDGRIYRNVSHKMATVNPEFVSECGLKRAMLLMYLVAGASDADWRNLYALIHYIVRCPNSSTGYILYLNDFDAGGNGKSKFVSVLQHMFGDSFTAFETHQLRFNISLMGKRLVHISEFEENENSKVLLGMMKAMTGRDKFQYEGKGMDPITAETYQNFVISSNRYIYFDDAGIKRRLQNFHCSNLLHILLTKHFKTSSYLNKLFGNPMFGESYTILEQMGHSLLDYILKDNNHYDIVLRPQSLVLGSLKNPILRQLFSERFNPDTCIRDLNDGSAMDLMRLDPEAKPEQYNYANNMIIQWLTGTELLSSRDGLTIFSDLPSNALKNLLKKRIVELDKKSTELKTKNHVYLEDATLGKYIAWDLLNEFIDFKDVNIQRVETGRIIK